MVDARNLSVGDDESGGAGGAAQAVGKADTDRHARAARAEAGHACVGKRFPVRRWCKSVERHHRGERVEGVADHEAGST